MDAPDEPQSKSDTDVPVAARGADERVTALLTRVAAGDEAAFASLYDEVVGRVLGLAQRITRNRALAEEVAQDVLVEIWRTAPRFDRHRGSGIGWILMLTHRRAVDRVRRSSARSAREAKDAARQPVQEPIDEPMLRREEGEQVRSAMTRLSDLQREAIELAYFGGRTYREVADELEIPEGTAKSRLRDGISQLRTMLRGGA
ncbi:MAG: sigma-70 family RNA polymerase sigma factor [Actinobacteria bacterium]|nr:sigma-70 family RNA polymerase sigma factor [Actinomycetota bacterium]